MRDGSTATIYIATPEDREALRDFFERLSPESRYQRFFSFRLPDDQILTTLCDSSNPRQCLTLIVSRVIEGAPRIIATGSYVLTESKKAEVGVVAADQFQGKGLATLLLERLSLLAVRNGIRCFQAVTHADNRRMLEIFQHSGFTLEQQANQGLIDIELSVQPGEASVARSELRDREYTTASLQPFFSPQCGSGNRGLPQGIEPGFSGGGIVDGQPVSRAGISGQPQGRSDLLHSSLPFGPRTARTGGFGRGGRPQGGGLAGGR